MAAKILFSATDPTHGTELWVTDGTAAGTYLLDDIDPGGASSYPSGLTAIGNGKAVFRATDGTYGAELWVTDGTAAGTTLVDDINPGSGSSYPSYITALGNGMAVFKAFDPTYGPELWVTDGTAAGTTLVDDINPGGASSYLSDLTAIGNGKAMFQATDPTHGAELWVTDGTAAGTTLVDDINPGSGNSYPFDLTVLGNGKTLFRAYDPTHGAELWVTDGTAAGTALVKDINPGVDGSGPSNITPLGNGKAVFSADDGTHGYELWVTDGTAAGTALVDDIYSGLGHSYPRNITVLGNGKAVFGARDATHGRELWVTDGTTAGTAMVKDIYPGGLGSALYDITPLGNGKAVFDADDGTHGFELWVTDGTAAGTTLVKDINPGSGNSYPQHITALGNGKAMFQANDGTHGAELWVTDGTAAGTYLLDDINSGSGNSDPFGFTVLQAPCYCRGTLILTEQGEAAVENLAIGDRVVTISGAARPIRWIGRRAYEGRFLRGNRVVLPIRIMAGAIADGVPARDLSVSPEHSLCIDGVLVQAKHLLNGATIIQAESVQRLEYFHIELDSHDVIFAEGMPAETFVDCDNRLMFHNGAEFATLHPGDERPRWQFCRERLEWDAAGLTAIRATLLERAEMLGHLLDTDPDLHLVVDGAIVRPNAIDGVVYRFPIAAGSTAVWLASRITVPAEIEAGARDVRRLGVPVERLVLSNADLVVEALPSDAGPCEGFHEDEGTHRWTDGLARLPETLLRRFRDAFTLEVRLVPSGLGYRIRAPAGTRAHAAAA